MNTEETTAAPLVSSWRRVHQKSVPTPESLESWEAQGKHSINLFTVGSLFTRPSSWTGHQEAWLITDGNAGYYCSDYQADADVVA